ncbi:DUF1223 domain-containing protein [Phenylobacterium aquaticum]|uniref:DUF1223 domain-containing protein n=1 Tax=Phenylobacterium aquaticum TaxID=1763816 RepID=UPI001F5CBCD9|nr:DUF1223 domain-containing protein [Phenylobacterium aquaticum]MCI3133652.1 DUF1223 domain-containing protein [Phenylobacterium aquaticum]
MSLRFAAAALTAALALAGAAQAQPLTVVELFTSQGCSSCPPADANLATLAARPDILALSFGVTYWDQLGWKDTFAQKAFTARQQDYAKGLGHDGVWTPQVVVNGRVDVVGTTMGEIEGALRKAPAAPGPVIQISASQARVAITAGQRLPRPAQVWLVRYEPQTVRVPVKRGENGGKTLPITHVVRELTKLGDYAGGQATYPLPAATNGALSTAVLIQSGPGGPILAAGRG